jgi:hypothetical protein
MVHKMKKSKNDYVEWGFDLTSVKSDVAFLELLKEFNFKEVKTEPLEEFMKGRWAKGVTTYANPNGIRITVEHIGGVGNDVGFLGYIGMKAPKKAEKELKKFLVKFRGGKVMSMDVYQKSPPKGITTYVKEENPYENPYITVR